VRKGGGARDFGINVDLSLARHLENADRVLTVQMDEKTGKPVSGQYYPVLVY
jgi:hypothetical protein